MIVLLPLLVLLLIENDTYNWKRQWVVVTQERGSNNKKVKEARTQRDKRATAPRRHAALQLGLSFVLLLLLLQLLPLQVSQVEGEGAAAHRQRLTQ